MRWLFAISQISHLDLKLVIPTNNSSSKIMKWEMTKTTVPQNDSVFIWGDIIDLARLWIIMKIKIVQFSVFNTRAKNSVCSNILE